MLDSILGFVSDLWIYAEKKTHLFFGFESPICRSYIKDDSKCNVILINGFTDLISNRLRAHNDWSKWIDKLQIFKANIFVPIFDDFENKGLQDHLHIVDNIIKNQILPNHLDIHIIAFSYGTLIANELLKLHKIKSCSYIATPIIGVNKYIYENSKDLICKNKTANSIANYRSTIPKHVLLIFGDGDCLVKDSKGILPNKHVIMKSCGHYMLMKNTRVIFLCIVNMCLS